jgi:hypothetical protein
MVAGLWTDAGPPICHNSHIYITHSPHTNFFYNRILKKTFAYNSMNGSFFIYTSMDFSD